MTARERVVSARRTLGAAIGVRAVVWALAAAATLLAIGGVIDWLVGAPRVVRVLVLPAAIAAALGVAGYALWRGRRVRSLLLSAQVALSVARSPSLRSGSRSACPSFATRW